MARKKKSSPIEDLFEIVALLPWWVGVVLAVAFYFFLHRYASQVSAPITGTAQIANSVSNALFKSLAGVFQYILPLICLAGAGASAWSRSHRKALLNTVTSSPTASALDSMTWREFEMLVGEGFRQKGYQVTELGGDGPDGGVDLQLTKGNEKFFVQCKQWKAFKVGVDVVRELYGVMAAKGAAGGFVVTSGTFTADAVEFSKGRNISLMDGDSLFAMLQSSKAKMKRGIGSSPIDTPVGSASQASPVCPSCGAAMIKREAKRGANAGGAFWGCSTYPKCRGTAQI